ncbi:MAG: fibronectin type III domain-containing protein, partial [Minisyncoccia bacterium]
TDGSSYSLLTTITDSALNYYRHEVTEATTSVQYYKAIVTTTQGNTSTYTAALSDTPNGQGISDTTAPVIGGIVVPSATLRNTSAVITFTTDELAKGTVQYKINGNEGWTTVASLSYVLAHSISIQGLTPNTIYNLQVKAEDASGNVADYTSGADFTTAGGPIITNVTEANLTGSSVDIEWDTATSSDSYVFYSTNQDVSAAAIKGSSTLVSCVGNTCHHTVSLPSLTANTTYYYYVQSTDGSSNTTTDNNNSTNYNFTTTLDVTAPVVSNISTPVISPTSAVIVWQTDDPSTSQVTWGTASGSLTRTTVLDSVASIYHVVTLSSATNDTNSSAQTLTAETPYYFKVQSADTAGNIGTSTEQTFTSTATGAVTIVSGGTPTVSYGTGLTGTGTGTASADSTTPPTITSVSIANIGAFGAEVNLVASKDTNAFVQYGLSTSYGSTEGDATFSSAKAIKLNNLLEGTTYHYRVVVFDKYGNTASSNDQTFKTIFVSEMLDDRTLLEKASDVQGRLEQLIESALPSLAPPFMTTPIVSSTTENSAVVTWKTNIKTFGSLRYATDAEYAENKNDYETEVSGGSDMGTTHTITLTNLVQNTTYHIQGRSYVFPQVVGKTSDILFSTKAAPITANIVGVKNDGFTVVWQTEEPTTSVVEYRNLKTGANNLVTDNTANTYHNVEIKSLPSGTTYTVTVYGVNKNGNRIESAAALRVTTSIDITAPVISNFKVDNALVPGGAGFIQTVVGWQTDELANSSVFYEEGGGVASSTKELANKVVSLDTYTTAHIVILPNLKSGTVYRIKVVSKDQSGNTKVFGPTSIITPNQTQSVLDIIVKNFEDTFRFLGTK